MTLWSYNTNQSLQFETLRYSSQLIFIHQILMTLDVILISYQIQFVVFNINQPRLFETLCLSSRFNLVQWCTLMCRSILLLSNYHLESNGFKPVFSNVLEWLSCWICQIALQCFLDNMLIAQIWFILQQLLIEMESTSRLAW